MSSASEGQNAEKLEIHYWFQQNFKNRRYFDPFRACLPRMGRVVVGNFPYR